MQHALRDFETADHAAGIIARLPARGFRQSHHRQRVLDALFAFRPRDVVEPRRQQQAFIAGQRAIRRKLLRHIADAPAYLRRLSLDVEAADLRRAGTGRRQRRQHLDQRAFARAIGPDQPENLARPQRQRHLIDGRQAAILLRQIDGFDGRRRRCGGIGHVARTIELRRVLCQLEHSVSRLPAGSRLRRHD